MDRAIAQLAASVGLQVLLYTPPWLPTVRRCLGLACGAGCQHINELLGGGMSHDDEQCSHRCPRGVFGGGGGWGTQSGPFLPSPASIAGSLRRARRRYAALLIAERCCSFFPLSAPSLFVSRFSRRTALYYMVKESPASYQTDVAALKVQNVKYLTEPTQRI